MSTISTIILILGVFITILYVAGVIRGLRNAFNGFRKNGQDGQYLVTDNAHWTAVILSIVGAAAVISAIGFAPAFVYAGPFLALVTAMGVGVAFFIEEKEIPPSNL